MRNKVSVLAFLLSLSVALTACTIQDLPVIGKFFGSAPSGPVTLTMWGLWENPDVINNVIKKYQTSHPNVTVNYDDRSVLKADDYKDRVFTGSGQSLGADIVMVHNSWVPQLKSALVPMPSKFMDAQKYATTFYPVASDSAVSDGKIYAVPLWYDGLVLVYNKKHFKEIGQTDPPTAWEELRRLALKLSVRSGEHAGTLIRAGVAIGNASNIDTFSDILGLMWAQAGVSVPKDLDTKPAADALTFYTNFIKEDGVWNDTFPEAASAFVQEKVSMIFIQSWQLLDILAARPDLEVGVAPVPQAIPQTPVTWGSFWMDVVPSSSKNAAAAWEFLNFLVADTTQLEVFSDASKTRLFGTPYSSVALAQQLQASSYLKPLLDEAPYAKSGDVAGRAGNKKQEDALTEAVNSVLSGKSAAEALAKVKDTLSK